MTTVDEITSRLNTTWKVDGLLNAMENGNVEVLMFLITLLEAPVELVGASEIVLNVPLQPRGIHGFFLNTTLRDVGINNNFKEGNACQHSDNDFANNIWDTLPIEVRSQIISKCYVLTRHLNNVLTAEEIDQHGNEIWKIVFENDLVDLYLSLLPQDHLPDVDNGLGLVKSKEMYQRLGELRPDLMNNNSLKAYLEYDKLWNRNCFENDHQGIPLRHQLSDYIPEWWSRIDQQRTCAFACCFNHADLAKHLLEDMGKSDQAKEFLYDGGSMHFGGTCFEMAVEKGYIDMAIEQGRLNIIQLLMTKLDPLERARDGKMHFVEYFAVVGGVDVDKAKRLATQKRHHHVVDFLARVQT
ncbi:hypothetical protein HDU76_007941, partial [Blyttiomyces sp. JEL0837]